MCVLVIKPQMSGALYMYSAFLTCMFVFFLLAVHHTLLLIHGVVPLLVRVHDHHVQSCTNMYAQFVGSSTRLLMHSACAQAVNCISLVYIPSKAQSTLSCLCRCRGINLCMWLEVFVRCEGSLKLDVGI